MQVLMPPGEPSGLYVPGGQAFTKRKQKRVQDIPLLPSLFLQVCCFTLFMLFIYIFCHLGQEHSSLKVL